MDELQLKADIERLARTLRQSRVASSESDAYRMAREMLNTSKKVNDDHKAREKEIYGKHFQNNEMDTTKKIMEKLTENLSKGKSNIRINMSELNLEQPLKELVKEESHMAIHEQDDEDDAVLVNDNSLAQSASLSQETGSTIIFNKEEPREVINVDDDEFFEDDDDDATEEEKAGVSVIVEEEASISTSSKESSPKSEDESEEFSIKEL